MVKSPALRAALLSLVILGVLLLIWHSATLPVATAVSADAEYAALMGGAENTSGFPTPAQFGATIWQQLSDPFYDKGANDRGIGIQLAYSIGRVLLGFLLAALVAIPLGFLIGMSPLSHQALNPFIQVLKPISPWPGCRSRYIPSRTRRPRRSS